MKEVNEKIHRLLAPRLIVTIGTVSKEGRKNIIPINNISSVGTDPGIAMIAVYREWITAKNLQDAMGFTISIPIQEQLDLIWKLAPKFSGYESKLEKVDEFKDYLDSDFSSYGPVLKGSLGWIECQVLDRPDHRESNHLIVLGKFTKARFDEAHFTNDLIPRNNPKPIMQWTRNYFSAADKVVEIPYLGESHR
ncbi:MAG TPA: flavin reductase [Candidatus Saccharimonadales bacterium]|nr:flavin reductase [Candidatus Saccharimonadales bacterium]